MSYRMNFCVNFHLASINVYQCFPPFLIFVTVCNMYDLKVKVRMSMNLVIF